MIVIYKAEETEFHHLGEGVLSDIVDPQVVEELNGQFYLEFDYLFDGNNFKEIKVDRIIKVNASPRLKDQLFRVVRVNRTGSGLIKVYAEHVSNHTAQLQLKGDLKYSGKADAALSKWASSIVVEHPFSTRSDVDKSATGELLFGDMGNAREALGGVDNSILAAFGGEYLFDNYRITLMKKRGRDDGVSINYGKNLVDVDQEDEIATVATTLFPYASYTPKRELVDKDNPDKDKSEKIADPEQIFVTLPEWVLDSKNVDRFARKNIAKKDFNGELAEFYEQLNDNYDYSHKKVIKEKIIKELRKVALAHMKSHSFGIPKVNLRVKFVDLGQTIDYAGEVGVEDIGLGDWVTVEFEGLGVSQRAQVTSVRYDPLAERYLDIDIGEARMNLTQKINHEIIDLTGKYEGLDEEITIVQSTADGKNKIYRGSAEPTGNLKNGDLWYKPVGDGEVELYIYQDGQWVLLVHSGMNQAVEQALEEAEQKIKEAREHTEAIEKDAQSILAGLGVPSVGAIHQELADSIDAKVGARINRVTDTAELYERVIGSTEAGVRSNVARIVMSDSIFRTDVSNKISGLNSSVTQLEGSWALRIESNDELVSAINASDRGVYVKGKDITFDGQVYTKGDFTVAGDMVASGIIADNITTGTLNAARIRVINIDANSIATGELSGVTIYGGYNKGFHVPLDADGVYNYFAKKGSGVNYAARWKLDDSNYIRQKSSQVALFIQGGDKFTFAQHDGTHWGMRISDRGLIKALATGDRQIQFRNAGDSMYIDIGAKDFLQGSNRALKQRVKKTTDKLDLVKKTPVFDYQFRKGYIDTMNLTKQEDKIGFIVEESPPEIVNDMGDDKAGISVMNTMGVLWKAVQELNAKVEEQDKRLEAYERGG